MTPETQPIGESTSDRLCIACSAEADETRVLCIRCRLTLEAAMEAAAPKLIERVESRYAAELQAFLDGPPPKGSRWWIGKPDVAAKRCAEAFASDDPWGEDMELRFLTGKPPQRSKPDDPRPAMSISCSDGSAETAGWIAEYLAPFLEAAIREAIQSLPVERAWRDLGKALLGQCDCESEPAECQQIALEAIGQSPEFTEGMAELTWLRYYVAKSEVADWDGFAFDIDSDLLPEPAYSIYQQVRRQILGTVE